ncbi:MAG: transporter substrate-binding domain-containing protein [Burkholderiales bacterium]
MKRAWQLVQCVVVVAIAFTAGCASLADREAIDALAPGGTLRVGLYPGTPTSIVGTAGTPDAKGVGYDLGIALAARAGVKFEPVVFPRNADVLAAATSGKVDMVFTNATPARRAELAFSATVFSVEQGYLVAANSPLRESADVDRPGMRIGVSAGSSSQAFLTKELRNATIVRTDSLKDALAMLADGRIDAFATNKPTLFEMSDELRGSRVLAGRYGVETFAIGLPKGRNAALPFVDRFVEGARSDGTLRWIVERAGLRGAEL